MDKKKALAYLAGIEDVRHFRTLRLAAEAPLEEVVEAVAAFQKATSGLAVDGMPGPKTLRALFVADGEAPPPVFPFALPKTLAQFEALVGHRVYFTRETENRARLVPNSELRARIETFVFPVRGGKDRVSLHGTFGPHILGIYTYASGVSGHLVFDVQGTVYRCMNWDPDEEPSTHSYGVAFDADPRTNGRGDQTPSIPPRFFSATRASGMVNGRDFGMPEKPKQTDPMHFQAIGSLVARQTPVRG